MNFLRLSFLFTREALGGVEIMVVPGVSAYECVGAAIGPWADPSHVSLRDPLCQILASQRCDGQMRCF